jgi:hypothetical protein
VADWLALSVRPPWSWAIVHASKDVENRTGGAGRWRRALDARLMIHASAGWSERGRCSLLIRSDWQEAAVANPPGEPTHGADSMARPHRVAGHLIHPSIAFRPAALRIQHAAVIGIAEVVDVHDAQEGCCSSRWAEYEYTDAGGQLRRDVVHLVLDQRRALPHDGIPARGRLGLWRPNADLVADVEEPF